MADNTPLQMASEFVHNTDRNIFLTGKAGTGKTTFLHNLKQTLHKRMAIVAPTGVAAINAGGVTIHSFFQLPFGPHIPGSITASGSVHKFNRERINLLKSLDLLVIDEISMVRADTLDAIDEVLRRYKNRSRPFGGVQLLMIGDLHQLSPVIRDEDWALLRPYYSTVYFFGSIALQQTNPVRIELTHIYRQSDSKFIDLLNRVRENTLDPETLKALNERYIPDFRPTDDEEYITLTTHNASAQQLNASKLDEIPEKSRTFNAVIEGNFPAYSYPTEPTLELKTGAQVMFVKNDSSREKRYYNGKIGQITKITADEIVVKCKSDYSDITVEPEEWTNVKYALNETTKEIEEQILGSFRQYPLKLAWAITIHKSQGLTFEKAIIDANASFAHGQVYVALSRCKSFEGMVLSTRIATTSVRTDDTVATYTKEASDNPPDEVALNVAKFDFQKSVLYELFDFQEIKRAFFQLTRILNENEQIINPATTEVLKPMMDDADREIFAISEKFKNQLTHLLAGKMLPEEDENVQSRTLKAIEYFLQKINAVIYPELHQLIIETDNTAVKKKTAFMALENLQKSVFIKHAGLNACLTGFKATTCMRAKANADIDFKARTPEPVTKKFTAPQKSGKQGKLYEDLRAWRDAKATENDMADYLVMPMRTLMELAKTAPGDLQEMSQIKGIGKAKLKVYGAELLAIIQAFRTKNNFQEPEASQENTEVEIVEKKIKPDTKRISFELFQSGKTIEEIAKERGYTPGTIETHLLHFIETGDLDIFSIFQPERINPIIEFFEQNRKTSVSEAKAVLGDVTYSELRATLKHLATNQL